jgi:vacuolar protein sorting-associated protein 16
MAEHPTTSWQAMQDGNVFYRQQRLYTLDGKLPSIGDCIVAGCRNGGPFGALALACHHKEVHRGSTALMRDTKKMIAIGPATPIFSKSQIQVYSPSGEGLLLLSVRVDCPVHAHIFDVRD